MAGKENALIVGVGSGLGAALARVFAGEGMALALAARDTAKLSGLAAETGARTYACDAGDIAAVAALFKSIDEDFGRLGLVVYNAAARVRGPIAELDPAAVEQSLRVTAFGAFLVGREAAKRMLAAGSGSILFTGASAGLKGFPQSAPFAMGKFALRGLAQSMARELQPQNIHIAHFAIDGGIAKP
jgi:NAD(P)-dependent dehydrogenase (short-subunit alcohol dehydrogenase family)